MHIFILTGAGISAESGLDTFRNSKSDGLWCRYDPFELATPEAFRINPELVLEFTNELRRRACAARPNPAHLALSDFAKSLVEFASSCTLVTQNVDDLHERAGATNVIHMHGEISKARCTKCEAVQPCRSDLSTSTRCVHCDEVGSMRPHLVWFGEMPLRMDAITKSLSESDLLVTIGTSGTVYPAAGFISDAKNRGIKTCEINLEPAFDKSVVDKSYYGPASECVPMWCRDQLAEIRALMS